MDLTKRHDLTTGTARWEDGSRTAGHERLWLASGFGGNGSNSAALAAELLTAELTGQPDPDIECFDPYRFNDTQAKHRLRRPDRGNRCAQTYIEHPMPNSAGG